MFGKRKVATLVAEFLGTGILTLLVLSVQRSTIGVPFFVALAAGLTLTVLVFALGGTSGAYLNPAISIGLWTARKLSTFTTILYVAVELLGAWGAFFLYRYFVNTSITNIGGHFSGRTLAAEAVGAGILGFVWAAATYQNWTRSLTAAAVGIAFMIGIVAASAAGVGIINPAVALGVRAWVWGTYVLGPVLGTLVGINLYGLLFATPDEVALASVTGSSLSLNPLRVKSSPSVVVEKAVKKPAAKRKTTAKKKTSGRSNSSRRGR